MYAAEIRHPNIVHVIDAGDDDGTLYFVMDLIEGTNLSAMLRESERLDPERALGLLAQAATGLDATHAKAASTAT